MAALRTVRRPLVPGEGPSPGPWNSEQNQQPGGLALLRRQSSGTVHSKARSYFKYFVPLFKAMILNTGRRGPADLPLRGWGGGGGVVEGGTSESPRDC